MSDSAQSNSGWRKKLKWVIAGLVAGAAGVAVLVLWFAGVSVGNSDPLFHGRPESEWIKNLKYWDDAQVKEWKGYGEEGVQVLIRGLERANRPGERAYRKLYRRVPFALTRRLPDPKDDSTRSSRMCMVSLLESLGTDAKSATPIMERMLKNDEADSVRQCVINFFNSSEDEKCLLNQLPAKEKQALLPALIRDVQNKNNWGLRNNAAISLKYFPEERGIVAPILTNAVHDPQPQVAIVAAGALNRVAPDLITNAGVVAIMAQILKNPDDQIAYRAAEVLGEMKAEPAIAVPALIEAMNGTNRLVATDATQALLKFEQPAELIRPALEAAMQRKDLSGWIKKRVKEKIDLMAAAEKAAH
ncbi:MAG: domain containing protein [Pedosphaera sp.]|nr:domain containing protein [Pedosphaera sp.]